MVFHSSDCKNYNIEKFTTHFTTWACNKVMVVKRTDEDGRTEEDENDGC
jgi:hypothetical protein